MADIKGREVLDTTPIARPVGWKEPPDMVSLIRKLVHGELSRRATDSGLETFEEADDFEVGDDFDPVSPHELDPEAEALPTFSHKETVSQARKAALEKFQEEKPLPKPPAP